MTHGFCIIFDRDIITGPRHFLSQIILTHFDLYEAGSSDIKMISFCTDNRPKPRTALSKRMDLPRGHIFFYNGDPFVTAYTSVGINRRPGDRNIKGT